MPTRIEPRHHGNPPRTTFARVRHLLLAALQQRKVPRHELTRPQVRSIPDPSPSAEAGQFHISKFFPSPAKRFGVPLRHCRIALILFTSFALTGCYSGYYLTSPAAVPAIASTPTNSGSNDHFPVYLASVTQEPADESEPNPAYAISRALLQTGLYPAVHLVSPQGQFIKANLTIRMVENNEEQSANIAKMVFTGASFFLLSAALPQTNHFDADYTLDIDWPNASHRRYSEHCGAYSYATLDKYRDVQQSARELRQSACLNSLVNQMSADNLRMTRGTRYTPPKGMTTGQLTQWGRTRDPNQARPDAVCTEVGLAPGTTSYADCVNELK